MPLPFECMRPMAAGSLGPARGQQAAGEQMGIRLFARIGHLQTWSADWATPRRRCSGRCSPALAVGLAHAERGRREARRGEGASKP